MNKKYALCVLLGMIPFFVGRSQDIALSTNVLGYLNLGTMNMEASMAFARHWSVFAGAKYNPFTFKSPQDGSPAQNKQKSYTVGSKYWLWHVYSGWWFAGKAQYQEYNSGGIVSAQTREGDRVGGGLSGGYTYMLSKHLNMDFGVGLWAGYDKYTVYACPQCGKMLDQGEKFFILPNELMVSLSYVF